MRASLECPSNTSGSAETGQSAEGGRAVVFVQRLERVAPLYLVQGSAVVQPRPSMQLGAYAMEVLVAHTYAGCTEQLTRNATGTCIPEAVPAAPLGMLSHQP